MGDTLEGRIGLFGGTFDPIHFGHLNLAIDLLEICGLEEVWFIPANLSPLRASATAALDRLNMVRLAVKPIPRFKVLDCELLRPSPSYTIDTVCEILSLHPLQKFALILGEDAALQFEKWKQSHDLASLLPLLIGCRERESLREKLSLLSFDSYIKEKIQKGVVETSLMEISATKIRKRIKEGLYCGHLLPMKVLDFIYDNQLYFTPE